MRSVAVAAALVALGASSAGAEQRLRTDRIPVPAPPDVGAVVNSKTIFMNRCTGGCTLTSGYTDSRTNKSQIARGTLSAYTHGNSSWASVMECMRDVFDRFNVQITDVDPGPYANHFEIMVAGRPQQVGLGDNLLGVAEYSCTQPGVCSSFLPNTIAFVFANYTGNDPDEICSTAAQEIAHTWGLDHVTDPSDPLTYYQYSGRRQFKDNVYCGSDCIGSTSPFGLPCTNNQHICMSTNMAQQDNVATILALFGPAGAVSPTLTINSPTTGAAVGPGFEVDVSCTSATSPIQEVQLSIDGVLKATLTAAPFRFTTTSMITEGPHKVDILCATEEQAITTKSIDIIIGTPCNGDSQCPENYLCFDGACIAGPNAPGGLGATCADNSNCIAGSCASDGEINACVIPCDLANKNCPDGFGCLEAGTIGVCWAGYDDGTGGCCDTRGDARGSMLLALSIGALWITRRRPHRSKKRK